jgi:hypothetical protein
MLLHMQKVICTMQAKVQQQQQQQQQLTQTYAKVLGANTSHLLLH